MINTGSHYSPLETIVTGMHVQFVQMYVDVNYRNIGSLT